MGRFTIETTKDADYTLVTTTKALTPIDTNPDHQGECFSIYTDDKECFSTYASDGDCFDVPGDDIRDRGGIGGGSELPSMPDIPDDEEWNFVGIFARSTFYVYTLIHKYNLTTNTSTIMYCEMSTFIGGGVIHYGINRSIDIHSWTGSEAYSDTGIYAYDKAVGTKHYVIADFAVAKWIDPVFMTVKSSSFSNFKFYSDNQMYGTLEREYKITPCTLNTAENITFDLDSNGWAWVGNPNLHYPKYALGAFTNGMVGSSDYGHIVLGKNINSWTPGAEPTSNSSISINPSVRCLNTVTAWHSGDINTPTYEGNGGAGLVDSGLPGLNTEIYGDTLLINSKAYDISSTIGAFTLKLDYFDTVPPYKSRTLIDENTVMYIPSTDQTILAYKDI